MYVISLALILVACSDHPDKTVVEPQVSTSLKSPFVTPACKENMDLFGRDIEGVRTISIGDSGTINGWCRAEITVAFDKSHGCHVLACPQEQGGMWSINFSAEHPLAVTMATSENAMTTTDIDLNTECGGAAFVTYAVNRGSATVRCANGVERIVANATRYRFVAR